MSGLPFSSLRKLEAENSEELDENKRKRREEWRKAKELEEARKAGTVPAAVDEEGKDINPHIPQYISTTPWYFGTTGPTLKHQRPQPEKQKTFNLVSEHYIRGLKGKTASKYRKGACENCGAMGHKKNECFERPRKIGAKFKSVDICADDVLLPNLALDFDGKRDRWNGFDPSEYKSVVEEHKKVEEYKQKLKAQKLEGDDSKEKDDGNDTDDEEKYAENIDMPGTKVDSKQRITVRNLRIREDTAKYLRNLDPNSAYYDPKTRSMRDNPYQNTGKTPEEVDFAGENFVRFSGDTVEIAKTQLFAWEAQGKGIDISLLAEPTKLEILKKEYLKKKDEFTAKVSNDLLDKYGGKEHFDAPPKELLLSQTENYVEYSKFGKVIKGTESEIIRSKYEEDVYLNNHQSVWGSYWKDGNWGYKCCHSFIKNSYCTGETSKSIEPSEILILGSNVNKTESQSDEEEPEKSLLEKHQEKIKTKKRKKKDKKTKKNKKEKRKSSDDLESSDSDSEEKKRKLLREALIRAKDEEQKASAMLEVGERSAGYNSMYENKKLTEAEIEAYYIRKRLSNDPMASFLDKS